MEWLLQEALLIRLDTIRELDELAELEQRALQLEIEQARADAIAALERG